MVDMVGKMVGNLENANDAIQALDTLTTITEVGGEVGEDSVVGLYFHNPYYHNIVCCIVF